MSVKVVTLDYLIQNEEGQYLERKSARIRPSDITKHLIAFANANGGVLVIGIEDNCQITGFNHSQSKSINDYLTIPLTSCIGNIKIETEKREIVINGEKDYILLFYIESSEDSVIKTREGEVYLRVGDKSKMLNHEQITQLEYDRGERYFEDLTVKNSSMNDVDELLLSQYKKILKTSLSSQEILEARGLFRDGHLTNAGVLLFSKNPVKFLPNARLRLLKYNGLKMETGKKLNLIKEINYEVAIPKIIQEVRNAINLQLREFQYLDENGVFRIVPEYPEFAWLEGIVNSLTHRNYSIRGDYVRVSLYDDRLEIFNPGKLPNIVTLDNILNTRYSRNPRIARVLSEFGWVKELNEGVKRIHDEMHTYFLKKPLYREPNHSSVLLILENSIASRRIRNEEKLLSVFNDDVLKSLSVDEIKIIQFLMSNERITVKIVGELIKRTDYLSNKYLKLLEEKEIVEWHGSNKNDPTQYYSLKTKQ